ncbi:MAG: DUF4340 domain-containing protein [Deltaproteobacteria bacterium]|nr:DUF4340 domain-containing protein [Deltaproteobacteria bacterium]
MRQVQRSLIAMLLVLASAAAAVAAVYHLKQRRDTRQEAAEQRARPFELEVDDVQHLTVARDGQRIALERSDDGWRITAPVRDRADDTAVDSLLHAAAGLRLTTVFESGTEPDAASLQLSPPRAELLLETTSGAVGIHLGRRNPFDGRVYLRAGMRAEAAPISMIDGATAALLDKDLPDLRDRRLLSIAPHRATALEVRFAGTGEAAPSYAAIRNVGAAATQPQNEPPTMQWDDPWRLTAPLAAPADADTVNQLLQQLAGASYDRVFSEEPTAPLSHYGLDPPQVAITVTAADGAHTLEIGAAVTGDGTRRLARRGGQSAVLEIPERFVEGLKKTPFDLEEKRALTFRSDLVRQLKLKLDDGKLVVIERESSDSDVERWSLLAPRPAPAKSWRVSSLLFALTNLKAKRYAATGLDARVEEEKLAQYGLDRPRQTIVAFDAEQRELGALLIGTVSGEEAFVMRRGGDRVLVVARSSVDELPHTVDELIEESEGGGDR